MSRTDDVVLRLADEEEHDDEAFSTNPNDNNNTSNNHRTANSPPSSFGLDVNSVTAAVGSQMLRSGSESASKLVSTYARIDVLRPYFDLDPKDLRQRLLQSIWPRFTRQQQVIAADMYGPIMLALTLSAVLLLSMKSTGHILRREGTLIGTSFAVSFGYWISLAGIMYAFGFIFNTNVTVIELLAVTGYSLFSYCVVLLSSHLMSGHLDFYVAWLTFGTLGALRLGLVLRSRTPDAKQGMIVFAAATAIHLFYVLYLQYAYATIYVAVSGI
eukprot:m.39786 g.39786  ORF g.39786 m.39786 type:complete len:271 (+) comp11654_c0_seq1:285-1097(+)